MRSGVRARRSGVEAISSGVGANRRGARDPKSDLEARNGTNLEFCTLIPGLGSRIHGLGFRGLGVQEPVDVWDAEWRV